ncbi:uncharacterized protein LOC144152221 isoform X4 [Haemaphysalis longicornis]
MDANGCQGCQWSAYELVSCIVSAGWSGSWSIFQLLKGRLEGLELGVPAACFGQRFCAWGAPCADVSDRAMRGLFTARPTRLSIVGVRHGLRYPKALHARLGAWSPHQQPPGMLQRCLPAGPLSAFSTLSRRRIDVAFTWLQRAGLVRQVRTPL